MRPPSTHELPPLLSRQGPHWVADLPRRAPWGTGVRQPVKPPCKVCPSPGACQNVVQWLDRYAVKLRQDRLDAGAKYAVCVTPAFPSGSQHIAIHESGTILVEPQCVVALVRVLRHAIIAAAKLREAGKDGKADKVLALVTTGDGQAKLQTALQAIPKLRALDQGMVRAARKHLDDSEKVLKLQEQNLGDVYHSIDAIIAGDDAASPF